MRKSLVRKILLGWSIWLAVLVVLAASVWFLARGTPSWYRQPVSEAAAMSFENKLVTYYDRLGAAHAWRVRQLQRSSAGNSAAGTGAAAVAPEADPTLAPFDLQFSDAELNAFLGKWAASAGADLGSQLQDPRLRISSGSVVLAAMVPRLGSVLSLSIAPRLDDAGQLRLDISSVALGLLPLPGSLWQARRGQIEQMLCDDLETDQYGASFSRDGVANHYAASAAMKELLLDALQGRPAEPVLFLPFDATHPNRMVPLKLEALSLGQGSIAMRVRELDGAERTTLLGRLRKPVELPAADGGGQGDSGGR